MNAGLRRVGRREAGSATVLVLVACAVLMFVGLGLGAVAAIVVAHRSAQAAADLTALGAASAVVSGDDGCAVAELLARANAATLVSCRQVGTEVTLGVRVDGPRLLDRAYDVTAEARAGPARGVP